MLWKVSVRVDEGRHSWNIVATKIKAKSRTVVGRGENSLPSDPGSESRLGREKTEKGKVQRKYKG